MRTRSLRRIDLRQSPAPFRCGAERLGRLLVCANAAAVGLHASAPELWQQAENAAAYVIEFLVLELRRVLRSLGFCFFGSWNHRSSLPGTAISRRRPQARASSPDGLPLR